jgi:hypothetical protein
MMLLPPATDEEALLPTAAVEWSGRSAEDVWEEEDVSLACEGLLPFLRAFVTLTAAVCFHPVSSPHFSEHAKIIL